jgi:hypothetical protein
VESEQWVESVNPLPEEIENKTVSITIAEYVLALYDSASLLKYPNEIS